MPYVVRGVPPVHLRGISKILVFPALAQNEKAAKRFQCPEKDADNFSGLAEQPRGA